MNVAAVMTHEVYTCHPGDSLNTAANLMWEHDCGCVPVVNDGGRVVGMLTDRDICMAAYFRGVPLKALKVDETMSKSVHSCSPQDAIDAAEKIMSANKVRRLAVVDDSGHLCGMLSLNDIARGYRAKRKGTGIGATDVAATLAAICERGASSTEPAGDGR
jgi:CBS domain-containing protein